MKNGIIAISVIAAAAAIGFVLTRMEETGADSLPAGAGGLASMEELSEVIQARQESANSEAAEPLPVPSPTGPWPRAVVEETTYDFDQMQVGEELEHTFVIRNDGEADMDLLEGKSTCKCTEFKLSSKHLKPGETSELKIRWIGKFRDENFRHGGPVFTNDPEREKISFAVTGAVDNAFELLPADVWSVGQIKDGGTGQMSAYVISKMYQDFSVTDVKPASEFVNVEVVPLTKARMAELKLDGLSGFELKSTVAADVPVGPLECSIEIKIDRVKEASTVNLTATRSGPIEILPSPGVLWIASKNGLKMGQFSASKGRDVELIMVVNEQNLKGDLQVEGVTATPAFITAELKSLGKVDGDIGRYGLTVSVPPGTPKLNFTGAKPATLELTTNHPDNPKLTISISFKSF